ncbi:patatin-like phospholipase domain-containing protein 2 isoform X2 [Hydra vulgaris]|uniref:Patatin-like phospholipase domain-containing protein 2 isoform X2 n=1 Tax=Hydra vulgaris TaxID=6087 RepID=A0ABM4BE25_HYDVU
MNLTFSGAGFLGIYHVGVVSCLKIHGKKFIQNVECYGGSSAGALAACMLLCDMNLKESVYFVMNLATQARSTLGPLSSSFDPTTTIRKTFLKYLPEDAYKLASEKLFISLTRVSDWKNVVVSNYENNEELVDALICSSFIPFFSGVLPTKYKNEYYIDGGFTDNLPQQFSGITVTVSPFSGESDICPNDDVKCISSFDFSNTSVFITASNIYRMSRALFPPSPDVLSKLCKQGFEDALKYLHLHYPDLLTIDVNIVSFPQCYSEDSGFCCNNDSLSYSSQDSYSDMENSIATLRELSNLVVPAQLNHVLKEALELFGHDFDLCWYFAVTFYRMAKWFAKPYIYMTECIISYAKEILHCVVPHIISLSSKSIFTKKLLSIALDIFHAYCDTATFEWHPSLSNDMLLTIAKNKERIITAQKSMVALPKPDIDEYDNEDSSSDQVLTTTYFDGISKKTDFDLVYSEDDGIFFNAQKSEMQDDYGFDLNIEQDSLEWSFVSGNVDVSSWNKFMFI